MARRRDRRADRAGAPEPPLSIGTTEYLLCTNVVLALLRGNALGHAIEARFQILANPARSIISVVTHGELLALARQFGWGQSKLDKLRDQLERLIQIGIDDDALLDAYAEIDHASLQAGRTMGKNDLWIAATARASGLTLLTTDRDFDHLQGTWIDLVWINPDTSQPQ